ncbi:MAG: sulfatase [Cyclobacterium sp.]|uniref:sulfatase n=1 Tax=unclassified Cyclobacterium TaxID=2615055 RepID=UPI0013D85901|nr:sulfatase [Cyclobacterium sp. SYSU L10401]
MKKWTLAFLVASLFFACQDKPEKKPNFVFILVDDLGWADIQANYADTFYETPHLDDMAAMGMRFTQAYAAHPVCSPTRAALMTGKHPNRVNITDWIPGFSRDRNNWLLETPAINHELALGETTLAEKFKEGGYQTFFIGKWHLGEEDQYWPEHQGFDINIGGWSVGAPQLKKGEANGYYAPYGNPRLEDGPEGEYLTNRLTAESIQLIRENQDNPFLLYLSFYTVHTPIQAAPERHDYFLEKKETLQPPADQATYRSEGVGKTKLIQDNAAYASMVSAMDDNVGKILQALKDTGLEDNTWVILTSDNGGLSTLFTEGAPTANGPLRAGKGWCYEGGIRVPLIIKGPGIKQGGTVSHTPVISMDMFPTLLSLAGIPHENNDGKNLTPLLEGEAQLDRESLIWHYPQYHGSAWKPGSAIREGKWKLIHFYENQVSELFDLEKDPGENENLSKVFPEKAEELQHRLMQQLEATGARFPRHKQ